MMSFTRKNPGSKRSLHRSHIDPGKARSRFPKGPAPINTKPPTPAFALMTEASLARGRHFSIGQHAKACLEDIEAAGLVREATPLRPDFSAAIDRIGQVYPEHGESWLQLQKYDLAAAEKLTGTFNHSPILAVCSIRQCCKTRGLDIHHMPDLTVEGADAIAALPAAIQVATMARALGVALLAGEGKIKFSHVQRAHQHAEAPAIGEASNTPTRH